MNVSFLSANTIQKILHFQSTVYFGFYKIFFKEKKSLEYSKRYTELLFILKNKKNSRMQIWSCLKV